MQNEILDKYDNTFLNKHSSHREIMIKLSNTDFNQYQKCQDTIAGSVTYFFSFSIVSFFILLFAYMSNHQKFVDWLRLKRGIKPEQSYIGNPE